jgi:aspartyl-tRNA(Asn)/glutamyl-tRNA(Gln) amidotransferase subunit B
MRSKEDAHDYRYFPDPDLLPLEVSQSWLDEIKGELPELPEAMCDRFMRDYGLSAYDAGLLTASRELATYFETVAKRADPKLAANWITGELSSYLNEFNFEIAESAVKPEALIWLISRISDGTISGKTAKEVVFLDLWEGRVAGTANVSLSELETQGDAYIVAKGLKQLSDSGAIEKIVDQVMAANAQQVADYRGGREKAFNSLVGQVMKATKGQANPQQVNDILKRKITN